MGTLEFEDKKYTFTWQRIGLLFVGAPIFALMVYFSHQWFWLHGITSKLTIWLLNLIYPASFESLHRPNDLITWIEFMKLLFSNRPIYFTPWAILVHRTDGSSGTIGFETLCTGVHAIAIFVGVILFSPHPLEEETTKDIWQRKILAMVITSVIFYFVNVIRMMIQLGLYRNGAIWEDVHYPISAASSFIAVACVLVMHKFVPEFIMALIWIGDELREKFRKEDYIRTDRDVEAIATTINNMIDEKNIQIGAFREALDIPIEEFDKNIENWAKDFHFTIEEDNIVLNKETIMDFLNLMITLYSIVEEEETEKISEEIPVENEKTE